MDDEHSHLFCNPHWKADDSYLKDQDSSGSIRIPVRALTIIWGNDSRFWQWIKLTEENRKLIGFEEGAVLAQVNWIEITGKFSIIPSMAVSTTTTTYEILYILKFRDDAFGWHSAPVKFKVRMNGEDKVKSEILNCYRKKQDEWHEIPGGQFTVSKNTASGMVEFGMFEVESDWWKGGMILAGIKIKPKLG